MAEGGLAHIVGAGLAGLSAAVSLVAEGRKAVLYEASPHAGGRCRSYFDSELSCRIDNGNHLLLSGNRTALAYLDRIGARATFEGPAEPAFPFVDAQSGERWTVRPNRGPLPWWIWARSRRVPGSRALDYLAPLALRRAGPAATVAEILGREGALYRRLWEPLAVAALNTSASLGSARLFWRVLEETLLRGAAACRPLVPRLGLSESYVDPALALLQRAGCEVRFGARLRAFAFDEARVLALLFDAARVTLREGESVVLAVPPAVAARLVPGLSVPLLHAPIVNAHFAVSARGEAPLFIGVIGGAAQWVFRKEGILSVTVSAAEDLVDEDAEALRERLWRDVALAYRLPASPVPVARIVKERRATFLASPEQARRRPGAATPWDNLVLAGDYTDTGLPATIGRRRSPPYPRARTARGASRAGAKRDERSMNEAVTAQPAAAKEGLVLPAEFDGAVARAVRFLLSRQKSDGHWVFELEADVTIPAEYILLQHYIGAVEPATETRLAAYIRGIQGEHGGWPLFYGGKLDVSASVKAYFALKAAGDSPDAPHMARARAAILAAGGAGRSNVFTRILLALWGEVPWRAAPAMPVELMLLPRWAPFHISKISYWSRTTLVPLLVVMAMKPRPKNPRRVSVAELFVEPPEQVREWIRAPTSSRLAAAFTLLDGVLRAWQPHFPARWRRRAIEKAVAFVKERLNGEDGLGAIFPPMANTILMYHCLGYPPDRPDYATARKALRRFLVLEGERNFCQPCFSPIWDTALACHALFEVGEGGIEPNIARALEWLHQRQIRDCVGDWAAMRPGLRPGGWAFEYENAYYPDLDDTAAVGLALDRFDRARYRPALARAAEWLLGMQSRNGGWASFDADNTYYYLNHIPFADHGALLDPPTADVSARCLGLFAQLGYAPDHPAMKAAIAYLLREQEPEGCWFGRWGTNYLYGTWSVLAALNAAGIPSEAPQMRRAVDWLLERQHADGGWGESEESYWPGVAKGEAPYSTASQTAWATLALMAAGEVEHPALSRGIAYLAATQRDDGNWEEPWYTAVGFPRVFYLKYHGYRTYFPLWALARYRRLKTGNSRRVEFGI
jgi:squalene-hopene/tetraprenyl-beta-curcumene cyclase